MAEDETRIRSDLVQSGQNSVFKSVSCATVTATVITGIRRVFQRIFWQLFKRLY